MHMIYFYWCYLLLRSDSTSEHCVKDYVNMKDKILYYYRNYCFWWPKEKGSLINNSFIFYVKLKHNNAKINNCLRLKNLKQIIVVKKFP